MTAPHHIEAFPLDDFTRWLEQHGATVAPPTNEYEVIRYIRWCDGDKGRPSTHIIYTRRNGTLTYTGASREHYEEFAA